MSAPVSNGVSPLSSSAPDSVFMAAKAALVSADARLVEAFLALYPQSSVCWTVYSSGSEASGALFASPPDIIICDAVLPDMPGTQVAQIFKGENIHSLVPVLLCVNEEFAARQEDWASLEVDDFIVFPCPRYILSARMELAKARALRTWDANPLTHLPGNTSIIRKTQGLIDLRQDFALCYCDLDNFKPFNDKYGFARGDEILMMTARLLVNIIRSMKLPISFVGHIGGDDFVFIVPVDAAEAACKEIIRSFDGLVPCFYDDADRTRGEIVSTDRQGNLCSFPLMGISIAVVLNVGGSLEHFGEASQTATNLKKLAKKSVGSCYVIDKRGKSATSGTE